MGDDSSLEAFESEGAADLGDGAPSGASRPPAKGDAAGDGTATATDAAAKKAEIRAMLQAAYDAQNLPVAVVAGIVAALVGAGLWAGITVGLERQIGFMALGVGALVGFAMKKAGNGVTPVFGFIGAGLAILGCVVGNVLAIAFLVAANPEVDLSWIEVILHESFGTLFTESMSGMDLLFYGFAAYEGYQFAFTKLPHPSTIR